MTSSVTDYAAYADQINNRIADRAAAVDAGRFGQRNDKGTWVGPDGCEVFGKDGIDMTAGKAALYSAREVPWHKLGTVTPEALTAPDALDAGGLNYPVEKRPIFFGLDTESVMGTDLIPGQFATVRTDTNAVLGVVGRRYEVFQNADAFAFLTELVADGNAVFETAGALDNGARVFVSLLLPDDIILDAEGAHDVVKKFLMAVNRHDGLGKFRVDVTPIRPVCANTVRWATEGAITSWSVRHTAGGLERVGEAQRTLKLTVDYYRRFEQDATKMIQTPMSDQQFDRFVAERIFSVDDDATDLVRRRADAKRAQARVLFREAETQANIRGTVWAAEQALIEQIDWLSGVRAPKTLSEDIVRAARVVDGAADERKSQIHRKLLTLTNR